MNIFIKLIIFLFEKYAFDIWVEIQQKEIMENIKKENNLNDDELDEFLIDRNQEPLREAYYAGKHDGVNEIIDRYNL
jgi:hypothetical protein